MHESNFALQMAEMITAAACAAAEVLALKHESRILRHCWDVLKVSTVFLTGLGALLRGLFSAQILA